MILLKDLIKFPEDEYHHIKVKFNQWNGYDNPIDLYKTEPDVINKQWLFWRTKRRYFNVGDIAICFAQISGDYWLLTTVKRVTEELNVENGINYLGDEFVQYSGLYGRTIVKFHKDFQTQCRLISGIEEDHEVNQILSDTFDDDDFPGYDRIKLSYAKLASILNRGKRDWIAALESQKAVYLITDTNTGKLYVGSATSDNGMLLQRWRSYAANGHGGNKELIALVNEQGFDYVRSNFQYSILENYNSKVDDSVILDRESWWKEVLQTRKFGYNSN